MKKFILEHEGNRFIAKGETLESVWEGPMPKVWAENLDKVVEEDITEEIQKQEKAKQDTQEMFDYIMANFETLKEIVEERKNGIQ